MRDSYNDKLQRAAVSSIRSDSRATALLIAFCVASPCFASITTYGNGDRDAWFNDVGVVGNADITTIGFNDIGNTIVTDQYAHLGVTFDGNSATIGEDFIIYQDGWGIRGSSNISFEFAKPRNAIATDYPGSIRFTLFLDGELVGIEDFQTGGIGNFAGLVSSEAFDEIVVDRVSPSPAFIDDLHFVAIPAPGALIPLLLACLGRRRPRRRYRASLRCAPGRG